MKYKYIGLTKRYTHETLGEIKLRSGDIIEDCSVVERNKDCFVKQEFKAVKKIKKELFIDKQPKSIIKKKTIGGNDDDNNTTS